VSRTEPSARVIARLLAVCAVLVGVFVMHGLPAQACPAGTGMSGSAMMAAPMAAHGGESVLVAIPARSGMTHVVVGARTDAAAHGGVCVFTLPPRGLAGLLALLLLAGVAVASLATLIRASFGGSRGWFSHRAPARAGPELLTTLCVSRT
jgi:hypothetical protein